MKTTSIFAATALAITFAAGSASATTGYNYIMAPGVQEAGGTVILGTIRASNVGYVEIVDYRLGQFGDVLGSTGVNAGTNSDVRVSVGIAPLGDVMAVLYDAAGNMVASEKINID